MSPPEHALDAPGAATDTGSEPGVGPRQTGGPAGGPERDRPARAAAADASAVVAAGQGDWIDLGALDEIPRLGARTVRLRRGCVAVFRTGDDAVFALADRCPHRGGPLSDGIVAGRTVTCPLHNAVIDLETGMARGGEGRARTHPVRVEDGRVLLAAARLAEDAA
jgi:nitrite reductase (NADH) small subunit